jgi:hypothetical protein
MSLKSSAVLLFITESIDIYSLEGADKLSAVYQQ